MNIVIISDLLEYIKNIDSNSIDLVVADYPFKIKNKKAYPKFIQDTIEEFTRILKK